METNYLDGNETIKRVSAFSFSTASEPNGIVIDTTYFIQDARRLARLKEERGDALRLFTTNQVLDEIAEKEEKTLQQRNPKISPRIFRNVRSLLETCAVEKLSAFETSCSEDQGIIMQEDDLLKQLQRGLEKTLYIEELEREKAQFIAQAEHIVQLTEDYCIMRATVHRYLEQTEQTTGNRNLDEACNALKRDFKASYQRAMAKMTARFQEIHYSISGSFSYAPYLERKKEQQRDLVSFLNTGLVQTLFRVVLNDEFRKEFSFYTRLEKNSGVDRSALLATYMLVPQILPEGPIAIATHDNDIMSLIELRQCTTLRYRNRESLSIGVP